MKILLSAVLLFSVAAFAEEDLFSAFERTKCEVNKKTKEEVCTLDGKKLPTEKEKQQAKQKALQDDELDIVTQ